MSEYLSRLKHHGYIIKSPVEEAEEIIYNFENSKYEPDFYETHKKALEPCIEDIKKLIKAIRYLKNQEKTP
jgi:hypothetical protein